MGDTASVFDTRHESLSIIHQQHRLEHKCQK